MIEVVHIFIGIVFLSLIGIGFLCIVTISINMACDFFLGKTLPRLIAEWKRGDK